MRLCPNLETIIGLKFEELIDRNESLVPKLSKVSLNDIDYQFIETFVNRYRNGLKSLDITFDNLRKYFKSIKFLSILKF